LNSLRLKYNERWKEKRVLSPIILQEKKNTISGTNIAMSKNEELSNEGGDNQGKQTVKIS